MSEANYFVAKSPNEALLGTWASDEVRSRLAAGFLSPAFVCLPTDATGEVGSQWRPLGAVFGPTVDGQTATSCKARAGRGRRLGLWVLAGALVAGSVLFAGRPAGRPAPPPLAQAPFTDLDAALTVERFDPDWVLYQPPAVSGPYRVHPNAPIQMIAKASNRFVGVFARDASGNRVEVDRICSEPGFDQLVVPIQTEYGLDTYAILKRERVIRDD